MTDVIELKLSQKERALLCLGLAAYACVRQSDPGVPREELLKELIELKDLVHRIGEPELREGGMIGKAH